MTGWALVGNVLNKTADGGNSWAAKNTGDSLQSINSGTILKTRTGGNN